MRQPRDDLVLAKPAENELLAPADDRQRNLLRVGGAEDEYDVRRRLLERLEQRVERRLGEHVRLIDDVDLFRAESRREVDLLAQVADLIDAAVRRRVDLDEVERRACRHLDARLALVARLRRIRLSSGAVDRLREQACRRRLARSPAAAERVRMSHATADERA